MPLCKNRAIDCGVGMLSCGDTTGGTDSAAGALGVDVVAQFGAAAGSSSAVSIGPATSGSSTACFTTNLPFISSSVRP